MRIILCAFVALSSVLTASLIAQDSETKVPLKDPQPAVQAAVKEQSKGATLKGLANEVESGATRYEAELNVHGRTKDVTFDETGKIVRVEQEVPLESVPPPRAPPSRDQSAKAAALG